jgi:FMN phosphatase YigB (HAD superfamily)
MPDSATRLPFRAITSFDLGAGREIYLRAILAPNATPERVVFFDDSGANVTGAQTVGIAAYQVTTCRQGFFCPRRRRSEATAPSSRTWRGNRRDSGVNHWHENRVRRGRQTERWSGGGLQPPHHLADTD